MLKNLIQKPLRVGLLLGLWSLVMWLGVPTDRVWALTQEQKLLSEAWRIVNRAYIDDSFNHQNWWWMREKALKKPLRDRTETYGAIQEMLAVLGDPFTRFLSPEQYRSLQTNTSGELTGVGLQIALDADTGVLTVVAPLAGSPADRAGILPQDRILAINGIPTTAMSLDEAAERMRGPSGSQVRLQIQHLDQDVPQDYDLVRDRIAINPVVSELRRDNGHNIGYVRLSQFNGNAAAEMATAIRELSRQGAEGFVLDLRNNPGGLLQAGIAIARQWIDHGPIVYTVNRQGVFDSFEATGNALTNAPLVALVNRGTASASEILAGALQDSGRAQLVGERTFGKGLIQSLFDLADGSGMAVTIAKYETPLHRDINQAGIEPNQVVEGPPPLPIGDRSAAGKEDPQYDAAVQTLVASLPTAVTARR
ncbi:MAG TPA: carboxyl-terminal processing protease CtpA [Coleofasciculaceae cyanobacterium]